MLVAEAGGAALRACTALHPAWYPGMAQSAETVRKFRELKAKQGWKPARRHGLELLVPPDGRFAIGRPEERLRMSPEQAGEVLDRMLGKKPAQPEMQRDQDEPTVRSKRRKKT
jgi:hypothetical protein